LPVLCQKLASLFLFSGVRGISSTLLGGRVMALDESPNAEISYSAEVIAEGVEATVSKYMTAADRVYAVLPATAEEALSVREIGDLVAADATGNGGLEHDTIRRVLNRDPEGKVDTLSAGERSGGRWWRL
jgi:hypothetical protein